MRKLLVVFLIVALAFTVEAAKPRSLAKGAPSAEPTDVEAAAAQVGSARVRASPSPGTNIRASPSPGTNIRASPAPGTNIRASPAPGTNIRASPAPGTNIRASPSPGTNARVKSAPGASPTGVAKLRAAMKAAPGPDTTTTKKFAKIELKADLDTSIFMPEDCDVDSGSCCLTYNDEVCGGTSRGVCTSTKASGLCDLKDFGNSLTWLSEHFSEVCVCQAQFSGAACEECAFGWTGDDCSTRAEIRVRQNFDEMTETEQDAVIAAFVATKNAQSPYQSSLSSWDWFAGMHYWGQVNSALAGQLSVNWHRMMTLTFERLMQKAINDDTFSLPYWPWTSGDNYDSATILAIGGNGDLESSSCSGCWCPIEDTTNPIAAFKNIGAFGVAEDTTVARYFGCNTASLPSTAQVERVVALHSFFATDSTSGFQSEAASLHDVVHKWVGGTMSTPYAASDPIFFLHHSYVDLLFTRWMLNGANAGYSDIDIATADTDLEGAGDACMAGFFPLVTHRQFWTDINSLGYTYDYFTTSTSDATSWEDDATTNVEADAESTTTTTTTTTVTTTATSSATTTASVSIVAVIVASIVAMLF